MTEMFYFVDLDNFAMKTETSQFSNFVDECSEMNKMNTVLIEAISRAIFTQILFKSGRI